MSLLLFPLRLAAKGTAAVADLAVALAMTAAAGERTGVALEKALAVAAVEDSRERRLLWKKRKIGASLVEPPSQVETFQK